MKVTTAQKTEIVRVATTSQIAEVRELFLEYAESLSFSLCFQSFETELAGLPGDYAPPSGRLLLATVNGESAGCCGLRKLKENICELKRLYVRPPFRSAGVGRRLTEQVIVEAITCGYEKMRLDTIVGVMGDAIRLYRRLGFREVAPYVANPIAGVLYMELNLRPTPQT
jgi:putative acetyltransferase